MRNRTIAALLVVSILAGVVTGYFVGQLNQPNAGRCTLTGTVPGSVPAAVRVVVSYQDNWRLSVVEFGSNETKASTLDYVCYYEGIGTNSFYVSFVNYQGWNTIFALAHKLGSTGTLNLTVAFGPSSNTNSTNSSYGDASTSLSVLR